MHELLVSGCPRSGTTALVNFFNNDQRFFLAHELGLFVRWHRRKYYTRVDQAFSPEHFEINIKNIEKYGLDAEEIRELAVEEEWTGEDCYNYLKTNLTGKVEYFGDKQPYEYLNAAEELLKGHPSAKLIIVLRDGRDVIASQIRKYNTTEGEKSWWMQPTVEQAEKLWLECAGFLHRETQTCMKTGRFLVVKYEDMTFNPALFCEQVADFLNLDAPIKNNGILRPTRIGDWRRTCPDVMNRVSKQFKTFLNLFEYI